MDWRDSYKDAYVDLADDRKTCGLDVICCPNKNGDAYAFWSEPHELCRSAEASGLAELEITTDPADAPADCEDYHWIREANETVLAKYGVRAAWQAMAMHGYSASYFSYDKNSGGVKECVPEEFALRFLLGYEYTVPGSMAGTCEYTLDYSVESTPCHRCNGTGRVHGMILPDAWACDVCDGKGVV